MEQKVDIKENYIYELDDKLLEILLKDHSSNKNIIWATDNYAFRGKGYYPHDHIALKSITGRNGLVIKPRVKKSKKEQNKRIKDKAEVFTPSWICNIQNNSLNESWFERKSVFNKEIDETWEVNENKIIFPEGKTWQDYVKLKVLEISCGEAPYLVSRYDTVSGEWLELNNRIGALDRKIRVVNENVDNEKDWHDWVIEAYKATFGYEWQGDSLLIARENLLFTFIDYYVDRFENYPIKEYLEEIAKILSWNIWQMDGLKYVIPDSCKPEPKMQLSFFEDDNAPQECPGCKKNNNSQHTGIYCKVMNWKTNRSIKFYKGEKKMKFDFVIGNPPYQVTVREASEGNNKNTIDVFDDFQNEALKVGDKTCLIYPAKNYQRGKKNLLDKHLISLRIYNGSSRQGEKHIPNEGSVFGDIVRRIPGDVGIVYYDNIRTEDQVMYQDTLINRTDKVLPVRKEFLSIANKLAKEADTFKFSNIGKVCESNFVQYNPESVLNKVVDRDKPAPDGYVKVLTNDKAGSGGKAKWFYIKQTDLDRQQPKKYKIVITSAYPNEAFSLSKNFDILNEDEFFGRSKLCIYDNSDLQKVNYCFKYLQTKFAKVINLMTPYKFLYYLPNFDSIYNEIDWDKSITDIENQLYKKYKFTDEEIELISKNV